MLSRREFLVAAGGGALLPLACGDRGRSAGPLVLNDIHSRLNPTSVLRVAQPTGLGELESVVADASNRGLAISIAGGRHSMGGQQFGTDTMNVDMRGLNRVLSFDKERGLIEVEAGIEWPELVDGYSTSQGHRGPRWCLRQKQTGADRLTLGGAVASNVHGRGLSYPPFVDDVESLMLLDAKGRLLRCSRAENPELFSLIVGGYGCFGIVYSLVLRLTRRWVVERDVEIRSVEGLDRAFSERIDAGYLFGDFQFKTDESATDFLQTGVFSCYRPVADDVAVTEAPKRLSRSRWLKLLELAHADKARAFQVYSDYYLSTDGQRYLSDTHQLSPYLDGYHQQLDRKLGVSVEGSEMISEVYVPRHRVGDFMGLVAEAFRRAEANVIYGTVRLIERDDQTFLPWACRSWACIVFNLHVDHSQAGIRRAREQFRLLIDLALAQGGSYFLTYHRWATRDQVEAAYPELPEFLRRKLAWDPDERFQSDWYRHYRDMFADRL